MTLREAEPRPGTRRLPRALPLLYLGTAHISCALAFALAALWPRETAGFFYHPWMAALVHLVTIGWITFSMAGVIHLVGPLALRVSLPVRQMDYAAYALAAAGLAGMVAHFWIREFSGMAWSAAMAVLGILHAVGRIAAAIRRAPVHPAVRLHIRLASANFGLAAAMGVLLAIDKVAPFLPGFVLANVFAHAHLAAIGWGVMMVVGVAYRLLPMILPSRMPEGPTLYASAILLQTGVLGLVAGLVLRSPWVALAGALVAAGLVAFAAHVVWMARHRVPRPPGMPPFDFAVAHAAAAGAGLAAALVLGLALLVVPASPASLRAAAAYGALGLVGFLAQTVVAMETWLLPLAASCWAPAHPGPRALPPPPVRRDPTPQALVLAGWLAGVPALAAGLAFEFAPLVRAGAAVLAAAVALAAMDHAVTIGRALRAGATGAREAA